MFEQTFVEPTVSRPSADRKSDRKNEHRRAAFLAASGRSRETASQMPGATSPPPLRAIGPDHDASTPTGRPLTGTVPDRSSRFSGLAPRPISQLALTLKNSTRRCTQLTRSSIDASRRGISSSMSDASARKPNSMPAEIRDSVASGAIVSGAKAGLSAASAVEQRPTRPSAARPA